MLLTGLIQITLLVPYNSKQGHILVAFGLRSSKPIYFERQFLKIILPGGGNPSTPRLIWPADQVQFYDLACHSKRLLTPGLVDLNFTSHGATEM